jgi:hypothetical protein
MKTLKIIKLLLVVSIFASCSSVFSPVGDKAIDLNTKCDNCSDTRNFYKEYGEAEIVSGPRVKMAAISQARTYARNEMVKKLGTEGMNIAAQMSETKTNSATTKFKENLVQCFKEQAFAMLENTSDDCLETKLVKKSRKGQEYVVATVCIKMSKKEYADNTYRENKKMLSSAGIDYNTFNIMLSGSVVDK